MLSSQKIHVLAQITTTNFLTLVPAHFFRFLGSGYSFGAYSQKLAYMLGYTQSQINLVPSLGGIGVYLGTI